MQTFLCIKHKSLSRLGHRGPGVEVDAEIMERTTNLSNHITDTGLKQTNGVFDNPAAFHATVDVFNTDAPSRQVLIEGFLLIR